MLTSHKRTTVLIGIECDLFRRRAEHACGVLNAVQAVKQVARADVHMSHTDRKCWAARLVQALDAYPKLRCYASEGAF